MHVSSAVIVTQKMFGYCDGLRAVSLFVNRSAMFVEAVFKSTFGFSYVLFVTVVTLYHVDNVFGVAVNVMINKSSFASRTKCRKEPRYALAAVDGLCSLALTNEGDIGGF